MRESDWYFIILNFFIGFGLVMSLAYLGPRILEDNNWIGILVLILAAVVTLFIWRYNTREVKA